MGLPGGPCLGYQQEAYQPSLGCFLHPCFLPSLCEEEGRMAAHGPELARIPTPGSQPLC